MRFRLHHFFLLLLPFLFGSCRDVVSDRPVITVSIEPLRYFVQSIGGDKFQVNTLVPAGASPETYELTPQQVVQTSDSRAYFCIGTLGFEQARLQKLTENAPNLLVVTAPMALLSFKMTIVTVILKCISKALIYTLGSQLPRASKLLTMCCVLSAK